MSTDQQQQAVASTFPFSRPAAAQPPLEYAKLRTTCPVSTAHLVNGSPIWLVTKMDDLQAVLTSGMYVSSVHMYDHIIRVCAYHGDKTIQTTWV
jgi:hypothetical protein